MLRCDGLCQIILTGKSLVSSISSKHYQLQRFPGKGRKLEDKNVHYEPKHKQEKQWDIRELMSKKEMVGAHASCWNLFLPPLQIGLNLLTFQYSARVLCLMNLALERD